jgi:hypothetical protein
MDVSADGAGGENLAQGANRTGTSTTKTDQQQEMMWSQTWGLQTTRTAPLIGDSALRAFTLKTTVQQLIRRPALHVNRTLQFGLLAAPDFASVNSLAGNKPGSSVGLTLEYEFANRWYLSSGLLLSRKNYAARAPYDYHGDTSWLNKHGVDARHLNLVEGSIESLEVPLDLRYDFSVAGSTLFFASAGLSSYLLTSENSIFITGFGTPSQQESPSLKVPGGHSYLFSELNLSVGVETGLSNSLSLLIAPYWKLPVRDVGFGQIQMTSVGVNFVLKFSPVISRRRRSR